MNYNYERWSNYSHEIEYHELKGSEIRDGVYKIKSHGCYLHMLISGLSSSNLASHFIISFNAALSDRSEKHPPFFCGVNLAKTLALPLVSFSDPIVDESIDLGLAWYLGSQKHKNLPEKIAGIIDHFAERFSAVPILIGGSGGGFAALNTLKLLKSRAVAVVWNPQTSISRYIPDAVNSYLREAFNYIIDPNGSMTSDDLYNTLESFGLKHQILKYTLEKGKQLIYLQNESDWHYLKHAKPFLSHHSLNAKTKNIYCSSCGAMIFVLGDWGKGHAAPSTYILTNLLRAISLRSVIDNYFIKDILFPLFPINLKNDFSLKAFRVLNSLVVMVEKMEYFSDNKFAFYLYSGDHKIDQVWYRSSPYVVFKLKEESNDISVKVFCKNNAGVVETKRIRLK